MARLRTLDAQNMSLSLSERLSPGHKVVARLEEAWAN